jgi:uncharacterized FlaG/YvyC family protein
MSSGVDNSGGIVLNRIFRPAKAVSKPDSPARPLSSSASAGSNGKQVAETSQTTAPDLTKLNASRKPDVNVNETLGVQDRNARFYLDKRVNKRVVQLRDANSHKLIQQLPSAESLDRMAKLRAFAGRHLDVKA